MLGFWLDLPHRAFAVRPGAEGHPRQRAARDLARLPGQPLQAAGLHAVGRAGRAGRRDQGRRVPDRDAHRRAAGRPRAKRC